MKFSRFIFGSLLFAFALSAFGQDTEPPSVPTNVVADSITETSIEISWERSTDNGKVADYLVYMNDAVEGITIDTSYLILNLIPDSTYSLWVTARDTSSNESEASTPILQITLPSDTIPPSIPENLISTIITQDTIVIAWDAAIDSVGVFDYYIYIDGVLTDSTHITTDTIPNLIPGTLYGLTVAARDSALNVSLPSDILELTTLDDSEAPTAPSGLAEETINTTSISISWLASTDNVGVTEYGIFVNGVDVGATGLTTYTIPDLGPEADYSIYVRARDAELNESESSDTLDLTTLSDTEAPTVPSDLLSSAVTTTSFDISWTASSDNIGVADYLIFMDGVLKDSSTITMYSFEGLDPSATYSITVSARDTSDNESLQSSAIEVTTTDIPDTEAPTAPDGLLAGGITVSSVVISWNPSSDNVGVVDYLVYVDEVEEEVSTDTSITISNLIPDTEYSITVKARDAANNISEPSSAIIVRTSADIEPPVAPTGLTTQTLLLDRIDFSWTAASDNVGVADYIIYVGGIERDTVNELNYSLIDLIPETEYSITVSARDAAGNKSPQSTALVETTPKYIDEEPPSPPGAPTVGSVTTTSIGFSWGPSTDNIGVADYLVYINGSEAAVVNGLTYTAENLLPLTTYNFYVLSRDSAGNTSNPSTSLGVSTLADTEDPTAPTNLMAQNIAVSSVEISWTASTDNVAVVDYIVYLGGAQHRIVTGASTVITGLNPMTSYEINVAARDGSGNISAVSNLLTIMTLPDTDAPSTPANLTAYGLSEFSIRVNWNASSDNVGVDSYLVFQDGTQVGTTSVNTYTAEELSSESEHSYYVIAVDAVGNQSLASNTATATTLSGPDTEKPTTPLNLGATNIAHTSLDLFWLASSDNVGVEEYAIFQNGVELYTSDTASFSVNNLTPQTAYEFYVVARDDAGNSSLSSNRISATTKQLPDVDRPSIPQNLSVADTGYTNIILTWTAATDNDGVEAYLVYQDGNLIDLSYTTSYLVENLAPLVNYTFFVAARDLSGNISEASGEVNFVIVDPGPDIIAPTPPVLIESIDPINTSISISWSGAYDLFGVSTYWVYVSDILSLITSDTLATIEGLYPNVNYSIYVTASDDIGNVSEKSNVLVTSTTGPNGISAINGNQQKVSIINLGSDYGFKILLSEPIEKLDIRIVDQQGRIVLIDQMYPYETELIINEDFKTGIYFVQLYDGKELFTKSFVISN